LRYWPGSQRVPAIVARSSGASSPFEDSIIDGRGARLAARHGRVVRDVADLHPTAALVEACAVAAGDRVEHEERAPGGARRRLGRLQERRADTPSADTTVHQHLREVGAVRLILRQIEDEVDRPADAALVLRDEKRARAGRDVARDTAPEGFGALAGQRVHEAHRRAALDAVDQHVGEAGDLGVGDRVQPADRRRHRRTLAAGASPAAITTA
jgi:hypothetical protein